MNASSLSAVCRGRRTPSPDILRIRNEEDSEIKDVMRRKSRTNDSSNQNNDHEDITIRPTVFGTFYLEKEQSLRFRLRYFFMNPCQKYRAKGVVQWKLFFQVLKIILVTIQLVLLGVNVSAHVEFIERTNTAFQHLFLKNWTASLETMPYPPTAGYFSVYTKADLYASINYVLDRYNNTEELAIGVFQLFRQDDNRRKIYPVEMYVTRYEIGKIFPNNQTYEFNNKRITDKIDIDWIEEEGKRVFDIEKFLKLKKKSLHFDRVILIQLKFSLWTVHLKTKSKFDTPDCIRFNIEISYDNAGHDGQVQIDLESNLQIFDDCKGRTIYSDDNRSYIIGMTVLDCIVILVSFLSFFLCIRSILKAMHLKGETQSFFRQKFRKELSTSDKLEFFNFWYLMIIANDVLTISGSISKIAIQFKVTTNYNTCCLLLGTGSLFVWFGVLRYLGFFPKYNILLLTLKKSAPNCLRFLVCALAFFCGFAFCGWVVLGPYHIKFRTLYSSCECLFSLINGDDMFVTFAAVTKPAYIFWYSRVYLYGFISLFIYIVLSVFISIISDAFTTIQDWYRNGYPCSELFTFIGEESEIPSPPSSIYKKETLLEELRCLFSCIPCIRHRKDSEETQTLLSPENS